MSQSAIGPINPRQTSGTELATLLRSSHEAFITSHSGTTRPSYATAGLAWLNTSTSPWSYNIFTGNTDATLFRVNPTTGAISFGNISGDLIATGSIWSGPAGGRSAALSYSAGTAGLWLHQPNGTAVTSLSTSGNDQTILTSVGSFTVSSNGHRTVFQADGNVIFPASVGGEAISTIRQRGIDALASAGTKLPLTGGTLSGPLTITQVDASVTLHNPGQRIWYMQATGSNLRIVDQSGGYEHTTFHPNGNITWNAVPNHGSVVLSNLVHWALRGEDQRVNGLRGIRQVDAGHVGVAGPGQDFQWTYAPYGSFFRGVRKSNTAAPDAFHAYYIQGYSDARGWYTID